MFLQPHRNAQRGIRRGPLLSLIVALLLVPAALSEPPETARLELELARLARPGRTLGFRPKTLEGARGLAHILEGRALPFAAPLSLQELVLGTPTLAERWIGEGSIPSPFSPPQSFPVGLGEAVFRDSQGTRMLGRTCLTCHAGAVAGRVVAGLPNAHIDLVPATEAAAILGRLDPLRALDPSPSAPRVLGDWVPDQLRGTYRSLRDYQAYTAEVLLPAYRHARIRGDNTGSYGAWFMTAKIADPARTGILQRSPGDPRTAAAEALIESVPLPPVDPAPWWTIRFKANAYRFVDAPGHEPLDFNFNFYIPEGHIDTPETLDAHRDKWKRRASVVRDVLTFARETVPPPLPPEAPEAYTPGSELARRGDELFHGGLNSTGRPMRCASCHGSYRTQGQNLTVDYPNRGRKDVGTDHAYNDVLRRFAPLAAKLRATQKFYGKEWAPDSLPVTSPGYAPPVLVGVWASAPYLHNGSVPTLQAMLTPPAERPQVWARRVHSPDAYDLDRVGLAYDVVSADALPGLTLAARGRSHDHPAARELRRVYDTREPGRSNRGHRFGTDLAPAEKSAIVAFLASLTPQPDRRQILVATP